MEPLEEPEDLKDLIQTCLNCGLIGSCEEDEEGSYWVSLEEVTFWLEPDELRRFLKKLLDRLGPGDKE